MKLLDTSHERAFKAPRGFIKHQYIGCILSGSCHQYYTYDTRNLTRRSVPVEKLKRGAQLSSHIVGLCRAPIYRVPHKIPWGFLHTHI